MIIGIGGEKGVGKDTVAEWYGRMLYQRLSFATPLRKILCEALQLPMTVFTDEKDSSFPFPYTIDWRELNRILMVARAYGKITSDNVDKLIRRWQIDSKAHTTPRGILQYVGTELFRNCIHQDFWCKALLKEAHYYGNVVVPDVRFPNERACIRDAGGVLIRVKRPGFLPAVHASEQDLGEDAEYDAVFTNESSREALWEAVGSWRGKAKRAV